MLTKNIKHTAMCEWLHAVFWQFLASMLNGLLLRSALAPSRGKQHQKHQPKQVSGVCWVYDIHASVCVCKFVYMSMHVCVLIRLQMHPLGAKSFFFFFFFSFCTNHQPSNRLGENFEYSGILLSLFPHQHHFRFVVKCYPWTLILQYMNTVIWGRIFKKFCLRRNYVTNEHCINW